MERSVEVGIRGGSSVVRNVGNSRSLENELQEVRFKVIRFAQGRLLLFFLDPAYCFLDLAL